MELMGSVPEFPGRDRIICTAIENEREHSQCAILPDRNEHSDRPFFPKSDVVVGVAKLEKAQKR